MFNCDGTSNTTVVLLLHGQLPSLQSLLGTQPTQAQACIFPSSSGWGLEVTILTSSPQQPSLPALRPNWFPFKSTLLSGTFVWRMMVKIFQIFPMVRFASIKDLAQEGRLKDCKIGAAIMYILTVRKLYAVPFLVHSCLEFCNFLVARSHPKCEH